jgi:hypothetical protein
VEIGLPKPYDHRRWESTLGSKGRRVAAAVALIFIASDTNTASQSAAARTERGRLVRGDKIGRP